MRLNLRHSLSIFALLALVIGFQNCGESGISGIEELSSQDGNDTGGSGNDDSSDDGGDDSVPLDPPVYSASYSASAVDDQEAFKLVQTSDGGFITTGHITTDPSDNGSSRDAQLIKWNMDGTLSYSRRISSQVGRNDQMHDILELNNHYLLSGFTWMRPNNVYRAASGMLIRVNKSNGSLFQTDIYQGPNQSSEQFLNITPYTDNGGNSSYIVAGEWKASDTAEWQTLLVKMDANFDVVWARSYGISGEDHKGVKVVHVPNEGFFITGRRKILPNVRDDIIILKVNESGTLLSAKELVNLNGFDVGRTVLWHNGELIVTGFTRNLGFGGADGTILRLDSSLNLLGSYLIGGNDYDVFTSATALSSGDLVFAGHTQSIGNGYLDGWVVKLNSNFEFEWSTVMGRNGDDTIYNDGVTERFDGGLAVTVSENTAMIKNGDLSNRNARLYLLSQYGAIESGCTGVYANQTFGMQSILNASVQNLSLTTNTVTFTREQVTMTSDNANMTSVNTCQ